MTRNSREDYILVHSSRDDHSIMAEKGWVVEAGQSLVVRTCTEDQGDQKKGKVITFKDLPTKALLCQPDCTTSPGSITIWKWRGLHSWPTSLHFRSKPQYSQCRNWHWEWVWGIGFCMKATLPVTEHCIYQFSQIFFIDWLHSVIPALIYKKYGCQAVVVHTLNSTLSRQRKSDLWVWD